MLINATFFHVLPTIRTRVYSPGLTTAVALFFPVGVWTYLAARANGALGATDALLSIVCGAGLMASPIVLLKIKSLPLFNYAAMKTGKSAAKSRRGSGGGVTARRASR